MQIFTKPRGPIARVEKKETVKIILFSVLLHGLFLSLLILPFTETKTPLLVDKSASIKSYLYKQPAKDLPAKPIKEIPEQIMTTAASGQKDADTPKNRSAPIIENTASPSSNTEKVVIKNEAVHNTSQEVDVKIKPPTHSSVLISNDAISIGSSFIKKKRYKQLLDKYLQISQTQYALDQALGYRQLQTSPIIDTRIHSAKTLTDYAPLKVNVDCGSKLSQILVSISGSTGGRLSCRNNSQFQYYIDKRLNKSDKDIDDSHDN